MVDLSPHLSHSWIVTALPVQSPAAAAPEIGEADARFDALVRAHYGRLCNFAARVLGSTDVVEDIVQDMLLAIWQRRAEFTYDDPLPYLYQAVRNRAVMHVRQRHVRDRWLDSAEAEEPLPSRDAAAGVHCSDLSREIVSAVNALPDRCRLVFTMSREQDLSYAEIARALDISVKTVEAQMTRALKALRVRLADYLSLALITAVANRWLE